MLFEANGSEMAGCNNIDPGAALAGSIGILLSPLRARLAGYHERPACAPKRGTIAEQLAEPHRRKRHHRASDAALDPRPIRFEPPL